MSHPVALVTGGARGIGREVCRALARDGFAVAVNYRKSAAEADLLVHEIASAGWPTPLAVKADVADWDAVKDMFRCVSQELGPVNVLVNNAGVTSDRLLALVDLDAWWKVIQVNLGGVVNCSKMASTIMLRRKSGRIINVVSTIGMRGRAGQTAYAASKSAIVGFSKSLAREFAPYDVLVNCVAPGLIGTEMTDALGTERLQNYTTAIPIGRVGSASEIASIVSYLASPEASYICGQVFTVDGGLAM